MTVLAALHPGAERPLRILLRAMGDDIKGLRRSPSSLHPYVDFARSRAIHFARFSIVDDPDRGPGRMRLLYASVYDGDLDSHLTELVTITSDLQAIWGGCEGYTGVEGFPEFVSQCMQRPEAYYIAFRDETVGSIHRAIAARRDAQTARDRIALPLSAGHRSLAQVLQQIARALPLAADVVRAVVGFGFTTVFLATQKLTVTLDRYPVFRLLNALTGNRLPPLRTPFSSVTTDNCAAPAPLATGDEIPSVVATVQPGFREDVVSQNQLTLVTVVDPAKVERVRAVMAAINSFATRLSPAGSLIGISTIHFVRWLLIDNGRRLMMVSDYDGSWESYIDEFAEMILSGLDAIWDTSIGYPPDGARDLPAFKRFLRSHQVPSEVFFSAYPDETVLNIRDDTMSARAALQGSGA